MPKLLQLNVSANRGSTGKIAEGIGKVAMQRGWESLIVYGRHMNPSESKLIKVGSEPYVYLHYAKNRFLDGEGLGSKRPTRRLLKIIAEYKPDIVHLHNIHDHWLNYPILFKYLKDINAKVVWTFHDCWAFTGGCYHFENDNCFKWQSERCKGLCPQLHKKSERNYRLKEELFTALGNNLGIVCVSEWMADYVKQSFLGKSANVYTIHNGIDTAVVFQPQCLPKRKMILGVSNIWPEYKGLRDFVDLRNLLPNDVDIVVVGLNDKQIKSMPPGIHALKRTSSAAELAKLYSEGTAFVNPTHNDTFPTVNLEALACGTPVITYRTGGSPEAVDSHTGIVVEKGNVVAMANAIKDVMAHPDRFKPEACRERAVTHFNQSKQFSKYIDLYETILSTK